MMRQADAARSESMEALIISGEPAAGKTTVAGILAKRLGIRSIGGGEILKELAKDQGYEPGGEEWWDTEEGIRFLKQRETDPEFDIEADRRMKKRIDSGNVIITSYTAPWISEKGFKVWLKCSAGMRAERMSKRDHFPMSSTRRTVALRDKENYELYKKLYHIEFGKDLSPFDIIIDTADKGPEQVADLIIDSWGKANK